MTSLSSKWIVVDPTEVKTIPSDKLGKVMGENARLTASRYFITYANWQDRDELNSFFSGLGFDEKDTIISHETGKSGYKHTHAFIKHIKNGEQFREYYSKFNFTDKLTSIIFHPHIIAVTTNEYERNVKEYITKEDKTDIEKIKVVEKKGKKKEKKGEKEGVEKKEKLSEKGKREMVMSCEDELDMLSLAAEFHISAIEMPRLIKMKEEKKDREVPKDVIDFWEDFCPSSWQRFYINIIKLYFISYEYFMRILPWMTDQTGGRGKNTLMEYLEMIYPDNIIYDDGESEYGPMYGLILKIRKKKGGANGKYVIFVNLPRAADDSDKFYKYLERVKDGNLYSSKNQSGKMKLFYRPLVIVCANTFPRINKSLTVDRFKIFEIIEDSSKQIIYRKDVKVDILSKLIDATDEDIKNIKPLEDIYKKECKDVISKEVRRRKEEKGLDTKVSEESILSEIKLFKQLNNLDKPKTAEIFRQDNGESVACIVLDHIDKKPSELVKLEKKLEAERKLMKDVKDFFSKGIPTKELSKYAVNLEVYGPDLVPVERSIDHAIDVRRNISVEENFDNKRDYYSITTDPSKNASGATSPRRTLTVDLNSGGSLQNQVVNLSGISIPKVNMSEEKKKEEERKKIEEEVRKKMEEEMKKKLEEEKEKLRKVLEEEKLKMKRELEDEMKRKNNAKSTSNVFLGPLSPPIKYDIPLASMGERKSTSAFLPVVSTKGKKSINITSKILEKYKDEKEAIEDLEKEYNLSEENLNIIKIFFSNS